MRQVEGRHIVDFTVTKATPQMADRLSEAFPGTQVQAISGTQFRAESPGPIRAGSLVVFLEESGLSVSEAREVRPSLEEVFVRVTGLAAQEMKREKERAGGGGAQ
jgi:ABC-2 type transport system ATP-binding protein